MTWKLVLRSSVIYIVNDNRSHLSVVLQVGGGNYHSVMAEQLPSLHFFHFTSHKHVGRSENKQLLTLYVKRARAADNLVSTVNLLGHVFDVMAAYLLGHIPLKSLAVGVFTLSQITENLFYKSHII